MKRVIIFGVLITAPVFLALGFYVMILYVNRSTKEIPMVGGELTIPLISKWQVYPGFGKGRVYVGATSRDAAEGTFFLISEEGDVDVSNKLNPKETNWGESKFFLLNDGAPLSVQYFKKKAKIEVEFSEKLKGESIIFYWIGR